MLFPPPKPSFRLIMARGPLKSTLPSARVRHALTLNHAEDWSWKRPQLVHLRSTCRARVRVGGRRVAGGNRTAAGRTLL